MLRKKDREALAAERAACRETDAAEARRRHAESTLLRHERELQDVETSEAVAE